MPATEEMLRQKELIEAFILRIERLEKRYEKDPYARSWMVAKEELIAVRDFIQKPTLFDLEG